jgi:hypothetical protein
MTYSTFRVGEVWGAGVEPLRGGGVPPVPHIEENRCKSVVANARLLLWIQ